MSEARRGLRSTLGVLSVALALLLAACGGGNGATDDGATDEPDTGDTTGEAAGGDVEPLEIELATWGSPDHENITSFLPVFEEELDERSNGAITVEHFSGGALAEDVDMPTAIPAGTVQMAWTTVNGWTGVVDATRLFDSPALQLSIEELEAALDDEDGLGGVLRDRFRDEGAEVLAFSDLGPAVIVGTEEILVPDDLQGASVRVFSEGAAAIVDLAGGSPASIPFAEVYTALQRGTVEYAHTGLQGVDSQQLHEVTTHGLVPSSFFGTTMMGWMASLGWWEGLDEQQREIISAAADAAETASQEALVEGRQRLIDEYAEQDLDVHVLESGSDAYQQWQDLVEPLAEEDRESLDPEVVEALDKARS